MTNHAALTICSINYIGKALVLIESYRRYHPDDSIYIVLVDRKSDDIQIQEPNVKVIWAEDLPIGEFNRYAFSYDVIELNTNVKPIALKVLLEKHDVAVYLDPDIKVYSYLEPVFQALVDGASIVVTPHSNTPILDGFKPDDLELLKFGAFNLGFIGVARCKESSDFLDWWSARCLEHGYYEPQVGLAVDQKWVGLAPCYCPCLQVLHDDGLNVAFWNLHERKISGGNGAWYVNEKYPLRFVHFSSFDADNPDSVAQKQTRFRPGSRPDFGLLARDYAADLNAVDSQKYASRRYGFDHFDDGSYITPALRRFYAALYTTHFATEENPFRKGGAVMAFGKRNGLLVKANAASKRHNFKDMASYGKQVRIINVMLRWVLFVLGPERYFNFMRYLAHISSLRNQAGIFPKTGKDAG